MKNIIFLAAVSLFIIGCAVETKVEPVELTNESCEAAGGHWNDCGSACRGAPPDTMCIAVCVEYCECRGNNQCPGGYECTEYIDETGICKIPEQN